MRGGGGSLRCLVMAKVLPSFILRCASQLRAYTPHSSSAVSRHRAFNGNIWINLWIRRKQHYRP